MPFFNCFLILLLGMGVVSGSEGEGSWNQFRGPNGWGKLDGSYPPIKLYGLEREWAVGVPAGFRSPFLWGRFVYLLCDGGILTAADAGTGWILYSERPGSPGYYVASPVAADGHVYLVGRRGVMSVIKAGKQFELVSQLEIGEEVHATPALVQGRILIRRKNNLFSISKNKPQ